MTFLDTSIPLPGFVREGLVSTPLIWGKLPTRSDYIRHNVKHDQAARIQDWIRIQLRVAKAMDLASVLQGEVVLTTGSASALKMKSRKREEQPGFWHTLSSEPATPSRVTPVSSSTQVSTSNAVIGQPALPWCFVLPPGTLSLARKQHVIGVWMDSSDKIGRSYPLVMMQTASPRWIKQYFSNHAVQPRDWLYFAARCMAQAVYAEETALDRPQPDTPDRVATLIRQLGQLWPLYQPSWREALGRGTPMIDAQVAQAIVGAPHPEDVVRTFDGVRYLPWADWPQRLTGDATGAAAQPAFWQQDFRGRFVWATQVLHAGL